MQRTCVLLTCLAACGGDEPGINGNELITTVSLSFSAPGSMPVVAEFNDPDGDGGDPPTIDPILLTAGSYALAVGFENRIDTPPDDITLEIRDEGNDHQVLFTGSAIDANIVSPTYSDTDMLGRPIGLSNMVSASPGTGQLTVTLRHMPGTKTDHVAELVKAGGVTAAPGESDASVTFQVTVPLGP